MTEKMGQWADVMPNIKNIATKDPRIFETPWEKVYDKKDSSKKKTYFACVVGVDGNNCYGVDVIRPWAYKADRECKEAFNKVKLAVYHYEDCGEWPKSVV